MPVKYDQETKAKAIRLVREHAGDYPSEYAAITAVARRLGMTAETLRKWIRQAEIDEGQAPGVTSEATREIRELSGSKIRPGARQGYGPPPRVKPRTPWKEADQVTSPQQPPPGATAHTKPSVHETRDAPICVSAAAGCWLSSALCEGRGPPVA